MKEKILQLLRKYESISVKQITDMLDVSSQYVHRVLKELLADGVVKKLGTPPKTFYQLGSKKVPQDYDLNTNQIKFLEKQFLQVTEYGERLEGVEAFDYWCRIRKLPLKKTLNEYQSTFEKYENYRDNIGLISGLKKLINTKGFDRIYLKEVHYADFYAIERFGKTKLGQLMHYGKMAQSITLIKEIVEIIKPLVMQVIQLYNIHAVGFIPPTISRKIQIMDQLKSRLEISLPHLKIEKLKGPIPIPQKSFNKIHQRITNAQNSMMVTDQRKFKHVLLIDDAVGSGATLNEVAGKYKRMYPDCQLIGFAVTGSFKGFEVISEV